MYTHCRRDLIFFSVILPLCATCAYNEYQREPDLPTKFQSFFPTHPPPDTQQLLNSLFAVSKKKKSTEHNIEKCVLFFGGLMTAENIRKKN